eukprot:6069-Rhodomonas_salina.2
MSYAYRARDLPDPRHIADTSGSSIRQAGTRSIRKRTSRSTRVGRYLIVVRELALGVGSKKLVEAYARSVPDIAYQARRQIAQDTTSIPDIA